MSDESLPRKPIQQASLFTPPARRHLSVDSQEPKQELYSNLSSSVRPLDRLRRPAPEEEAKAASDTSELIKDLSFNFNIGLAPEAPAVAETTVAAEATVAPVEVEAVTDSNVAKERVAIAVSVDDDSKVQKTSHRQKGMLFLLIVVLAVASTAGGYVLADLLTQ